MEKSQTNATNAPMPLLGQKFWDNIWKHTVEKSLTKQPMRLCILTGRRFEDTFKNAQWRKVKQMQSMWLCNMHALIQVHWGHIWKPIVEKSQTNATNAIMHPQGQTGWGNTHKNISLLHSKVFINHQLLHLWNINCETIRWFEQK